MTIKSKNTSGVVAVLASDTVIHTVTGKIGVEAFNVFNTAASDVLLNFYISPDDTSANGDLVDSFAVAPGEEIDVNSIVGQGYLDGTRIIMVADIVGVNASFTYTQFVGGDI